MTYRHAERNLDAIRPSEAKTGLLFGQLTKLDLEQRERRTSMRPADRRHRLRASRIEILKSRLVDPSVGDPAIRAGVGGHDAALPLRSVPPGRTLVAADCFLSQRTSEAPSVVAAYEQLKIQTDRQYAVLTSAQGLYRFRQSAPPSHVLTATPRNS